MSDATVRRLVSWHSFWIGLILASVGVWRLFIWFDAFHHSLRVTWSDSGLRLSPGSDGPFVVTHLALMGGEAGNEGRKEVAALIPPIGIIDSDGANISAADLSKLVWRDVHGQQAPPPRAGAPIRALYFRPLSTPPADQ